MAHLWGKGGNQVTLTMDEVQGLVLEPGILLQTPVLQQADSLWGCTDCWTRQLPASLGQGER